MDAPVTVTQEDIARAVRKVGVREGDICLFHSSLKSFGRVEGGAFAVISAMEEVLGREGTLVAPTLCQVDFANSYKTWYMDKPSDVGYLTEYFRKQLYVYRSDQATHSVAARGKLAYELTHEHTAYGPHICPFGDYAFADSSPWMKMYRLNAKILFLGVSMLCHTMKHLVEGMYVERLLEGVGDPIKKMELFSRLRRFDSGNVGVWPFYDSVKMQDRLGEMGMLRAADCGNARILCVDARDSSDAALEILCKEPENWFKNEMLQWIRDCEE